MGKILIGAIFAILDFTFTNGTAMRIGLLPDFIGCFLIFLGLKEMMQRYPKSSAYLNTAKTMLLPLTAYAAVLYVLDLTGKTMATPWLSPVTSLIYYAVLFYILYLFLQSLYGIEGQVAGELKLDKFKRWWTYTTIFQMLICVLILVLCFRSASVEILFAYYICAIMALVCEVLYLVRLNGIVNTLKQHH